MQSHSFLRLSVLALLLLCVLPVTKAQKGVILKLDSRREVSGRKFALKDISPGLPADWDGYNYVVLEIRSSTPQRFHIGFTTATGYNELRVMSYCANGWNKLAIPLRFFRALPDAAHDLAATYNQARYSGWINLGGKRGPMKGIDSIGIRMHAPIGNPVIELKSVSLSVEDPGDLYLGIRPVVDEFGQWNLGNWKGKIKSAAQLNKEWAREDADTSSSARFGYSRYGGFLAKRVKATGFFRTEKIDDRWWFVDPDGYLFLSHGVDCVSPGGGGNVGNLDKRRNMYKELPPENLRSAGFRPSFISFGRWNLYRRYGESYPEKSRENIVRRMDKWGLNTICNWSSPEVYRMNKKAFMLQLNRIGIESGIMGLPDVYTAGYAARTDSVIRDFVAPNRENPWLIGYFTGNEPSWLGQEERLCGMILNGPDRPFKTELTRYIADGDSPDKRKKFILNTFRIFLKTVNDAVKKHDPNHLNLGIRFGNIPGRDILGICREVFDVFSFNCYDLSPRTETINLVSEVTGLPMIIGEFHFGTVDRGMAQSLWQVNSQAERGIAYSYYTEHAFSHPGLIGTAWFQWCDQDLTGRNDGENYNCGFVDVTDRPYPSLVEAVAGTSGRMMQIHNGSIPATVLKPVKPRGHGAVPDQWEK